MEVSRVRPWLLAATTYRGRPVFARFGAGAAVGGELALMRASGLWDVLAWVLLPCRFDAVIMPLRGTLDDTVPRFLAGSAARVARAEGGFRPVWATRFSFRLLEGEVEAEAATRRIVRRPLQARLTERLADYPFWDSVWLGAGKPVAVLPDPSHRREMAAGDSQASAVAPGWPAKLEFTPCAVPASVPDASRATAHPSSGDGAP